MANIKISQLPQVTSVNPTDVLPTVASGVTSKITAQNLASSLPLVNSASYAITASYALNGGGASPTSTFTKFWVQNQSQSLQPEETIVVSEDYVMKNSQLVLSSSADYFSIGPLTFERRAELYIGGHMLLVDTNVVNDGLISVAGGIILSGSSTITGTGIII